METRSKGNEKNLFRFSGLVKNYKTESAMSVALILLVFILSILTNKFLTSRNLMNVLYQVCTIGIMAVGQCMVIITGGIDLSVGSNFALAGWIMVWAMNQYGIAAGIVIGLVVAVMGGLINGIVIAYFNIDPFIVTLGSMSVYEGLAYIVSNTRTIRPPAALEAFDDFTVLGIPAYVVVLLLCLVLGGLYLKYTKPGRMLFAIGSNEEVALYTGVDVKKYKLYPYIISGFFVFVAALVQGAHLMTFAPNAGGDLNMNSIAAVVIGGTAMTGGKGTMIGTVIGVLFMGVMRNGLNLLGLSTYWQSVAVGIIIVIAVSIEKTFRSKN